MVVTQGQVGIGMTPSYPLHILAPITVKYALVVSTGLADSQRIVSISTTGILYTRAGVTSGGDLAELYPAADHAGAGDVVMLAGSGAVAVCRALAGAGTLLGVVATQPGMTLGTGDMGETRGRVPVALSGRVPVKVTAENGAIKAGDALAPSRSKPGYAMKASATGRVIGVALESFSGRHAAGSILCFVNPHTWVDPHNLVNPRDLEKLQGVDERLNRRLAELESRLKDGARH